MSHTYASVAAFRDYIRDNGSSETATNDALLLGFLEAASRKVDDYCDRSRYGSGFGPRIGTNRYSTRGDTLLELRDDILTVTSVTTQDWPGGTTHSLTEDTDYYTAPDAQTQKRQLSLTWLGIAGFGWGQRGCTVAGVMGFSNDTVAVNATVASGLSSGTTATTFVTSASPDVSPGQTLYIGTEQLYLRALSGTQATVTRGANGTTAATHVDTSAIAVFTYDPRVVDATLQVALRRFKQRDAGASGAYGGGTFPESANVPLSELTILNATVGSLRINPYA